MFLFSLTYSTFATATHSLIHFHFSHSLIHSLRLLTDPHMSLSIIHSLIVITQSLNMLILLSLTHHSLMSLLACSLACYLFIHLLIPFGNSTTSPYSLESTIASASISLLTQSTFLPLIHSLTHSGYPARKRVRSSSANISYFEYRATHL